MKLLRVRATNFKNCQDDFTIDFFANSKKAPQDEGFDLQRIAAGLYAYNLVSFTGKNASGKTTVMQLLDCCYSILGEFRLVNKPYPCDDMRLDIIFYHDGFLYRYETTLKSDRTIGNQAAFVGQHIYSKKYYASNLNEIYDEESFLELKNLGELPEDVSIVFFILKKKETRGLYLNNIGEGEEVYRNIFRIVQKFQISEEIFSDIVHRLDENIQRLERLDDYNYRLVYQDEVMILSEKELCQFLSAGTTRGMLLCVAVDASLKWGFDLVVDDIELHLQKTIVESVLSLYKDKIVNKNNASLIFSTHYLELLDSTLFLREQIFRFWSKGFKVEVERIGKENATELDETLEYHGYMGLEIEKSS